MTIDKCYLCKRSDVEVVWENDLQAWICVGCDKRKGVHSMPGIEG